MSDPIEQPKRTRGRPRLAAEDKKRRNMTFRVRDELRDAVEELAHSKGRSISEQIEHYVEAGVFEEIKLIYQYSQSGMSEALRNCSATLPHTNFRMKYSSDCSKSKSVLKDIPINQLDSSNYKIVFDKNTGYENKYPVKLPFEWSKDPEQLEGALHMARAFLHAARKGSVEALDEMLGSEIVATALTEVVLAEAAKVNLSIGSNTDQPKPIDQVASLIIEGFREIVGEVRRTAERQPSPANAGAQDGDHSLPALVALIGRLTARSPDLNALWSSSWPRQFADLPAETRTALLELLEDEAVSLYEIMMRPELPRSSTEPPIRPNSRDIGRCMRMDALRRMQERLLPLANADNARKGQDKGPVRGRG